MWMNYLQLSLALFDTTAAQAGAATAGRIKDFRQGLKISQPEYWANRLDRIKSKFTPIPGLIDDEAFDHTARTAPRDFIVTLVWL
jgi:hypothetical protein